MPLPVAAAELQSAEPEPISVDQSSKSASKLEQKGKEVIAYIKVVKVVLTQSL